jgi:hypothetical protein
MGRTQARVQTQGAQTQRAEARGVTAGHRGAGVGGGHGRGGAHPRDRDVDAGAADIDAECMG